MCVSLSPPAARLATLTTVGTATGSNGGDISKDGWSSLIGIVTAIVGNVLISFALNTQRYAHIRLSREREEMEKELGRGKSGIRELSQAHIDEQRARADQRPDYPNDTDRRNGLSVGKCPGEGAQESDPLIPPLRTRSSASRGVQPKPRRTSGIKSGVKQKSYLRSPYWWIGIILMTVGEAGNFLAYGFAPASIVSPLGVVALISNCIIAPFMLEEPFRKRDFFGVIIAVAGAVIVVLSASDNNPKLGPDKIWYLITTWEFETYLGITTILIVALMTASKKHGEKSIFIDLGLVGLFGGYTALSTKGVASLLSYTLWRALTFPVTYLLVAVLVGTAIMQIKYVNHALQRFDATEVIPIQFVLFTLSVIIGSAVLYRDFEKTPGGKAGKFVGGCALTFLGVWLITSARTHDPRDEEDMAPEDDEAIHLVDEEQFFGETHEETDAAARRASNLSRSRVGGDNSGKGHRPSHQHSDGITSHPRSPGLLPMTQPQIPAIITSPRPSWDDNLGNSLLDASSPLATNPWQTWSNNLPESSSPSTPHPQEPTRTRIGRGAHPVPPTLKATTSAPVLPSEAQILPRRPHTPRKTSDISATLTTLRNGSGGAFTTLSRNPIAGLLPGPYTSPLSATFSAVVADSLRRDVKRPAAARRKSAARLRVSTPIPLPFPGAESPNAGVKHADVLAEEEGEAEVEADVASLGTRGRSSSGTVRELFRCQWMNGGGADGRDTEMSDTSNGQDGYVDG